jgi:dTDP-4-amino-4,6-dideoxygalactose transaminase
MTASFTGFRYGGVASSTLSPVGRLEQELAVRVGTDYGICVNSCSSAILLALLADGLQNGEFVLCPAFTFISVPSAITLAGGRVALVECDENYVVDIDDLEKKIIESGARRLVLSYMRGHVPDLRRLMAMCHDRNVTVIEDAAHALGVTYDGMQVGSFGTAGVFSFQSHKIVDGGEGGFLGTSDPEIAARVALMSGCYEENWKDHHAVPQAPLRNLVHMLPIFNMRMPNATAEKVLGGLNALEAQIIHYCMLYGIFVDELADMPGIRFPMRSALSVSVPDSIQFALSGDDRQISGFTNVARQALPAITVIGAGKPNARCFWRWGFVDTDCCPNTRELLKRTVDFRLPGDWTADEARFIARSVAGAWRAATR